MELSSRKRKGQPDEAYGHNSKRQRALPKSTRNLISLQNAKSSPFLRLPAEIRNQIYEYALSNKVIHISVRNCPIDDTGSHSHRDYYRVPSKTRNKRDHTIPPMFRYLKFTHTLCRLPYHEESRCYEISCQTEGDRAYSDPQKSYPDRHAACYRSLGSLKLNWIRVGNDVFRSQRYNHYPDGGGLPVALLRSCSQIHREAHHLLYTTNTFAFHEGYTLNLFFSKGLLTPQKHQIRSIQVDGHLTQSQSAGCIEVATIKKLKGLQTLQLWFRWGAQWTSSGLGRFSQLPLSSVQIVVGENLDKSVDFPAAKRRQEAFNIELECGGNALRAIAGCTGGAQPYSVFRRLFQESAAVH